MADDNINTAALTDEQTDRISNVIIRSEETRIDLKPESISGVVIGSTPVDGENFVCYLL